MYISTFNLSQKLFGLNIWRKSSFTQIMYLEKGEIFYHPFWWLWTFQNIHQNFTSGSFLNIYYNMEPESIPMSFSYSVKWKCFTHGFLFKKILFFKQFLHRTWGSTSQPRDQELHTPPLSQLGTPIHGFFLIHV